MILALIAIGWIGIAFLCFGACALAARGDGRGGETGSHSGEAGLHAGESIVAAVAASNGARRKAPARDGLVVWEGLPELRVSVKDATPVAH
jgi:hypothetical protein